jgi:hypothetical protein
LLNIKIGQKTVKKTIFYYTLCLIFSAFACQLDSTYKPKIGDAVLYDYVIKQGETVVFQSSRQSGDTTTMILEDVAASDPTKKALTERLKQMSENDTLSFDLAGGHKGFLRVYRVIPAKDFPKYIAEADKKQAAFEQRLREIGKELNADRPVYEARRKAVLDSAKLIFEQYKNGQLATKLTTLNADNQYFIVKGNDKNQEERKKWVWFHYVTYAPDGKTIIDSYNKLPRGTNVAEFTFNEALEKNVARFDEGTTAFFSVPAEYQNDAKTGENATVLKKSIYWVEVIKVLNF